MDKKVDRKQVTTNDVVVTLQNIGCDIDETEVTENEIPGEYKDFAFIVDEDYNVSIDGKAAGERPTITIAESSRDTDSTEVTITVTAKVEGGKITKIESLTTGGIQSLNDEVVQNGDGSAYRQFKITKNGDYSFKTTTEYGRTAKANTKISDLTVIYASILEGIEEITTSGDATVKVRGRIANNIAWETKEYALDVTTINGDLNLDGINDYKESGATLTSGTVYSFGKESSCGTASTNATKTVVLKVNGNITIENGMTLTSVKNSSGYGGPKGMIIYCTGTITNNGTISMTARGGKAVGENVYLWKNADSSFEFVPAVGAAGGASVSGGNDCLNQKGINGTNGSRRQTGGGGSGQIVRTNDYMGTNRSGSGGAGTSFSGGPGGGSASAVGTASYVNPQGNNGNNNGGSGGVGVISDGHTITESGSGAGNPGGSASDSGSGKNGTGGLLCIYTTKQSGTGNIVSCGSAGGVGNLATGGSSGGGSINIFFKSQPTEALAWNLNYSGGTSGDGGAGGSGTATCGYIDENGSFVNM